MINTYLKIDVDGIPREGRVVAFHGNRIEIQLDPFDPMQLPSALVVDMMAITHTVYHSRLKQFGDHEIDQSGKPIMVTKGFLNALISLIEAFRPIYLIVATDSDSNWRKAKYPWYKEGRPGRTELFLQDVQRLKKCLTAINIPVLEKEGYEADDLIASICRQWPQQVHKIVTTGDKDLLQVVSTTTSVNLIRDGVLYNPELTQGKTGVYPKQIAMLKALMGDPCDNIQGGYKIGEKTAIRLCDQFPTLEDLYENLDQVKDSDRAKLETSRDDIMVASELVQLPIALDVPSIESCRTNIQISHRIRNHMFQSSLSVECDRLIDLSFALTAVAFLK